MTTRSGPVAGDVAPDGRRRTTTGSRRDGRRRHAVVLRDAPRAARHMGQSGGESALRISP